MASRFRNHLRALAAYAGISLGLTPIILFSSEFLNSTTAYASDETTQEVQSETESVNEESTTESASLEVVQEESTVDDTQSSETEDPPVEATTGESEATSSDEATVSTSDPEPDSQSAAVSSSAVVTEIVTSGGDDSSYRIPLEVPIIFDGVSYTEVYATTNSVITFGRPDGTFSTYPTTPSISIASRDWWALPGHNPNMHFIIRVSEGGFQIDGAYLPYGTMQGEITNIVITAQIQTDGTVSYTYSVTGPLYGGERTGARLHDGSIVSLEQAGMREVDEPVALEAEPVEPPVLYAPTNLRTVQLPDGRVELLWDAPVESNTAVERYAVFWSTDNFATNGWAVASVESSIYLSQELFESTGGLNETYQFRIRSDNDSSGAYSEYSEITEIYVAAPALVEPEPIPVEPEPTEPEDSGAESEAPTESPIEPEQPTEPEPQEPEPIVPEEETLEPPVAEPTPETEPSTDPSEEGPVEQAPEESPLPTPESPVEQEAVPAPPTGQSPQPSEEPEEVKPQLEESEQPKPAPTPTPQPVEPLEPPLEKTPASVLSNPDSTTAEKVDAIISLLQPGESVDVQVLLDNGISFDDLPPETPILVREDENGNEVVITAEVAAALAVFDSPEALLTALIADPLKVLTSLGNVGKDMSEEEREESEKVIVAAVIVSGIAQAAMAVGGGAPVGGSGTKRTTNPGRRKS